MYRWNRIIPIIFLLNILTGQSLSTVDTLYIKSGEYKIRLKPFIVNNTFFLFHEGKLVEHYQLNKITGELKLENADADSSIYLASYRYLEKPLPIQIGPQFKSLPQLDSLIAIAQDTSRTKEIEVQSDVQDDMSNLATTGTVYRNLTLSPLGGTDFSGGLQLQLQGSLSNDITVSGILSDQSIPIQPEGTTQALEEIDKVYLHVSHPIFQIMAGDIDYTLDSGKFLTVSRKLEGIKSTFKYEKWSGKSALAGTKGRYHELSFKGTDGSQGPYSLSSETGNNDIIVLAGTEKVYLNGEFLKRGENYDYIIDYSIGEVTFTPRRLIDFDSDIYIEYQYSDFQYNRNVLSASVNRELGDWGNIGFSWFKEKDQLQIDETLAVGLRDSLRKAGDEDAIISGAIEDEDGKYLLLDGIFVYSPNTHSEDIRYKVSFQNDNDNGEYARRISDDGHLYFEYVNFSERSDIIDIYSPFRKWSNPVNHEIFQVSGGAKISKHTHAVWDLSLSNLDKNIFSNIDDGDNVGFAHNIGIVGKKIAVFKKALFGYNITNWRRSDRFNKVSRDRNAQFNRDWNIQIEEFGKESLFSGGFNFQVGELLNSIFDFSQYNNANGKKNRLTGRVNSASKIVPKFNSYINMVQTDKSNFYQYNLYGELLPGKFRPIFSYMGEFEKKHHKFDIRKIGFLFNGKNQNITASITQRKDFVPQEDDSTSLQTIQDGIFGEIDFNGKYPNGWSSKIVLKRRISDNLLKNEKLDYAIGLANIRFNNKTNPIRWELHSKLEETYTESRAVVYDSIGVGLGSYRYDPEFNEYISDPNGAYISHTVLTGDRELTTAFIASQRLSIDFAKTPISILKSFDLISDLRSEYRGKILTLGNIFSPALLDDNIAKSKINFRNEIDYNPSGSARRIRNWVIYSQNLLGTDPRGNDLRNSTEFGLEWREPISKQLNSVLNVETHKIDHESVFSELRNRNMDGWWIEQELKWNIDRKWQFSTAALGGRDSGLHNQKSFSAYAYGIKFEGQRFISTTSRIKLRTDLFNSIENSDNSIIPPEALNGLPLGQSISVNLQGQILLGKNLSLNASASYIDNSRYTDFITLSGELRAYF